MHKQPGHRLPTFSPTADEVTGVRGFAGIEDALPESNPGATLLRVELNACRT